MFLGFKKFATRFRPEQLILTSAIAGILRWAALAFSPEIEWLFPLQFLQAFTYAIGFLTCTNLIAGQTGEELAGGLGAQAFLPSVVLAAVRAFLPIISMVAKTQRPPHANPP
jgi:MFS1 family protein